MAGVSRPVGKSDSSLSWCCGRVSEIAVERAHLRYLCALCRAEVARSCLCFDIGDSERSNLATHIYREMQPSRPVTTPARLAIAFSRVRTQVSMILDGSGCGLQIRR